MSDTTENTQPEEPMLGGDPETWTPEPEEASEEAPQEQPAASGLGIEDLNLMAQVLEIAGQRGAIKAEEMQVVGNLYNKLFAFLVANGVRQAPSAQAADQPVHTHDDGTEHAHEGGDADHSHDKGENEDA